MSCVMRWSSYTETQVLGYGHGSNGVGVGLLLDYMLGYLVYSQVYNWNITTVIFDNG